jgi:putative tricarboxylic transport membrane protein
MRKHDLIMALIWMGLGITLAVSAYRLGLGELRSPGPGLMPFLFGISLSACSLPIFIRALRVTYEQKHENLWSGVAFKRLIVVVASLLSYTLILEKVGFAVSTFFLLFLLFKAIGSRKWSFSLIVSVLTVAVSYFVFVILLKVELPLGLLELR